MTRVQERPHASSFSSGRRTGPGKSSIIVTKVFASEQARAVCKYDVVFGETFFCSRRRRHDEDRARPEMNEENRTVLLRKLSKGAMEGPFYEMEMAYDGKGKSRAWWETFVLEQPSGKKIEEEKEDNVAEQ